MPRHSCATRSRGVPQPKAARAKQASEQQRLAEAQAIAELGDIRPRKKTLERYNSRIEALGGKPIALRTLERRLAARKNSAT